jgi:hypothetical protein
MAKTRAQDLMERFSDQMVRFNPYAVKKMGLLQSQTLLKLEDYMLICAPFQLSMKRAALLVILSAEETNFFRQFQGKMVSLSFTFQRPGTKSPINLFIRGILDRMGPVKGKNNICLMELSFRNCPNDLIEIIGDFLVSYESLKNQYETFKDRAIELSPENARIMRFNNYVESQVGSEKMLSHLVSLAVNRLVLDLRLPAEKLKGGVKVSSRLYFQTYQFSVLGEITEVQSRGKSHTRVHCQAGFTPELVEIVDDYFFRLRYKR